MLMHSRKTAATAQDNRECWKHIDRLGIYVTR